MGSAVPRSRAVSALVSTTAWVLPPATTDLVKAVLPVAVLEKLS